MTSSAMPIPTPEYDDFEDYFGFEAKEKFMMPDGVQFIQFRIMDEGLRAKYQQNTAHDVRASRKNDEVRIKTDQAKDRQQLILDSICGWNMFIKSRDNKKTTAPYCSHNEEQGHNLNCEIGKWLKHANPKIVDDLELAIRKANPWMQAEMSPEDIQEEIDNLYELKAQAEERLAREQAFQG